MNKRFIKKVTFDGELPNSSYINDLEVIQNLKDK